MGVPPLQRSPRSADVQRALAQLSALWCPALRSRTQAGRKGNGANHGRLDAMGMDERTDQDRRFEAAIRATFGE